MFSKNELIIYNNEGVCRVDDICPLKEMTNSDRLYYKLSPIYGKGSIFIPVDTKVFMRPVITKTEALNLISKIPEIESKELNNCNQKQLTEQYRSSLFSHDCEDLVRLIKTVYFKSKKQAEKGKKPSQTDQRYMKRAEELLNGELAVALDIKYEDVPEYIENELASNLSLTEELQCC